MTGKRQSTWQAAGERHHKAKLTDHEVALVRQLADEAINEGQPAEQVYVWLAEKFEVHPRTVKKYVYWEARRGSEPD